MWIPILIDMLMHVNSQNTLGVYDTSIENVNGGCESTDSPTVSLKIPRIRRMPRASLGFSSRGTSMLCRGLGQKPWNPMLFTSSNRCSTWRFPARKMGGTPSYDQVMDGFCERENPHLEMMTGGTPPFLESPMPTWWTNGPRLTPLSLCKINGCPWKTVITYWLVGQGHPVLKNMSSSIGMMTATQYSWENKKWQPNHQPA